MANNSWSSNPAVVLLATIFAFPIGLVLYFVNKQSIRERLNEKPLKEHFRELMQVVSGKAKEFKEQTQERIQQAQQQAQQSHASQPTTRDQQTVTELSKMTFVDLQDRLDKVESELQLETGNRRATLEKKKSQLMHAMQCREELVEHKKKQNKLGFAAMGSLGVGGTCFLVAALMIGAPIILPVCMILIPLAVGAALVYKKLGT